MFEKLKQKFRKYTVENGVLTGYVGGKNCFKVPQGVTTIGKRAFKSYYSGTMKLTKVCLPDTVVKIDDEAMLNCKIREINIPEGVTSIGNSAFAGCRLIGIDLPNSLTEIGEKAFVSCSCLKSVTVPGGVGIIKAYTFTGCGDLKHVK